MNRNEFYLASTSTIIAFILIILVTEVYERYAYNKWKSSVQLTDDRFYDGLTVASTNPILMWEYRSNGKFISIDPSFNIQTNNHGFRDRNYITSSKPNNTLRYAFIGDSVTLGLFVNEENTFTAYLQSYTNKHTPNRNIEIMNFGVDGYNTVQLNELLLTKVLKFKPDFVIYMMCLNDFDFDDASGKKIRYFKQPKNFFLQRLKKWRKKLTTKDYHDYYFDINKDIVFNEIRNMKYLLDEQKVAFHLILIPVFPQEISDFRDYPFKPIHKKISNYMYKSDITYYDLLPKFIQRNEPPNHFAIDVWHPNREGHKVISEHLAELLFTKLR